MSGVFTDLMALRAAGRDRFIGPAAPEKAGRMFGGQFMAQALAGAYATVDDDRFVHSLHAYFLRAGDVDATTELSVERVRDGRSFSVRSVIAGQGGKESFRMTVSFQVPEDGPRRQASDIPPVPPPEAVHLDYTMFTNSLRDEDEGPWPGEARPMDIRYVNPPVANPGVPINDDQFMWMRVVEALPEDRAMHDAALLYLSDATLVDHVWLPHGRRWQDRRAEGASLDHAMWFHEPVRADRWVLFDQRVEFTGGARGLASGRFYTETGDLVASCSQEGLMRWTG